MDGVPVVGARQKGLGSLVGSRCRAPVGNLGDEVPQKLK